MIKINKETVHRPNCQKIGRGHQGDMAAAQHSKGDMPLACRPDQRLVLPIVLAEGNGKRRKQKGWKEKDK